MTTTVSLGEICQFVGGGTPSRKVHQYWNGSIPWATVKDFETDRISRTAEFISQEGLDNSASKLVPSGTILLVTRVSLGKVAMAEVDLAINQDIKAIVPSNDMLPEFLLWSLKHLGPEIERKGVGATVKGVTLHDVKELKASLPPLHEQHRIVGILNRASHIERLRARATDRLQQFIPALFLKMFGDPAVNPMGWSRVPLGQICAIVGGGTPRRDNTTYFGGPVPWATPTDVTALSGPSIGSTRETLTETGVRESSARLVPAGTVLLTSRATIGYTAIAAAPMTTNQGFANLICGERLLSEYLAIWLRLRRDYLIQLAGGTTFKEISKSTLKKIEIPVPPLEKQHEFATLISCAYRTMDKAQTAADTAAALSASLMDRLLA